MDTELTELDKATQKLRDVVSKLPLPFEAMAATGMLNSCLMTTKLSAILEFISATPELSQEMDRLMTKHMLAMAESLSQQFDTRIAIAKPKINGKLIQ